MHYSHRLSQIRIQQIVGTFVLVPLLILGAVLFMVAKSENLFEDRYQITTLFSEGHGLKPGQPVVLLGIQIGKVFKVAFTEQSDAKVTLEILNKYREKIRQNSVAKVGKSGGFVGDPQIEITVGNKSQPIVPPDGHIEGEEPFSVAELLAQVKPLMETVKGMVARVDQITQDVHATVKTSGEAVGNVRDATTRLPETLENVKHTSVTIRDAARTSAAEITGITASVRKNMARVGEAVEDMKVTTAKLPAVVDSAKGAVDNMQIMTGDLKDLVRKDVPPLVRSAQGTVDDLNDVVAGAKQTFPLSVFSSKGKAARSGDSAVIVPRSLRRDDLSKE
jgi:phospholipid/cholesterol/gamma-HCH transport system substrate-binding protein